MISIELNKYSAEDVKLIKELRAMGLDEDTIQNSYDKTQKLRKEEKSI